MHRGKLESACRAKVSRPSPPYRHLNMISSPLVCCVPSDRARIICHRQRRVIRARPPIPARRPYFVARSKDAIGATQRMKSRVVVRSCRPFSRPDDMGVLQTVCFVFELWLEFMLRSLISSEIKYASILDSGSSLLQHGLWTLKHLLCTVQHHTNFEHQTNFEGC